MSELATFEIAVGNTIDGAVEYCIFGNHFAGVHLVEIDAIEKIRTKLAVVEDDCGIVGIRKYTMVAVFRNSHILQRDSKIRRCKEYASAKIRPIDGVGVYDF